MIAVSGGVDSMVLLDVLRQYPEAELVVAHFEHGIRADSDEDRKLVELTARRYDLPFVFARGKLGAHTNEATARQARYVFLRQVQKEHAAKAIITAHHQDDLIETAVLNVIRGTRRKGLASLQSNMEVVRPLLHVSKQAIQDYAAEHTIIWREDSTNADDRYLRNYIRHHIVSRMSEQEKLTLLELIGSAYEINPQIDVILASLLKDQPAPNMLDRLWFVMLPHAVACEVMAAWLRRNSVQDFDKKTIERLVAAAKVSTPGKVCDINAGYLLKVSKTSMLLWPRAAS